MAELVLSLRLTLETGHVRGYKEGREIVIPQRLEVQNDASTIFQVLDAVDTAVEKYKTQRQRIKKIRRMLRPVVRKTELTDAPYDGVISSITISDDALKFLVDLFDSPPEGVILRGPSIDTAEDLRDLYDENKRAEKESGTAGSAEPTPDGRNTVQMPASTPPPGPTGSKMPPGPPE